MERIAALLDHWDALLVDIRSKPRGRAAWQQVELRKRFAGRYQHVAELGNSQFRSNILAVDDLATGILQIRHLLKQGPLLLFCACADYKHCHRTLVADALNAAGMACRELATLPLQPGLFDR